MLGLLLVGGMLGALVIGGAFDGSDTPPPEVEDDPPAPEGIDLLLTSDSDTVLNGTEGDDTLTSDDSSGARTSTEEVHLGGGDDVATTHLHGTEIYGGDGDDTMTADNSSNTLYGEAGDDILSAHATSEAYGGEGNDTISVEWGGEGYGGEGDDMLSFDSTNGWNSNSSTLDGGAGDDVLVNTRVIGQGDDLGIYGGVGMTGGEGHDTFNLELELQNGRHQFAEPGEEYTLENRAGAIRDFDPNEDSLVIDIHRGTDTEDREMTSATLEDTSYTYNGVNVISTTLVMNFEGSANSDAVVVDVVLRDVSGLTMDDIVINFT